MKKMKEVDCCDVCFAEIVPFWSARDICLCNSCAKRVLDRLAIAPINKAVKRARMEVDYEQKR